MSGYKNLAIAGAGTTGNFIVSQYLKDEAARMVNQVIILTRPMPSLSRLSFYWH